MTEIGPQLVIVGCALLLVPVAGLMGPFGYALIGGTFVGVGALLSFSPGLLAGDGAPPTRTNCPACGAPNDPDARSCHYCESELG